MTKQLDRFKNVQKNPIIIVGQNPGNQRGRAEDHSKECWVNNRSADYLNEIVNDVDNIIFTNACQHREMSKRNLIAGLIELQQLVDAVNPSKIVALGVYAKVAVDSLKIKNRTFTMVGHFAHPSFILRFNKNKDQYEKELKEFITR